LAGHGGEQQKPSGVIYSYSGTELHFYVMFLSSRDRGGKVTNNSIQLGIFIFVVVGCPPTRYCRRHAIKIRVFFRLSIQLFLFARHVIHSLLLVETTKRDNHVVGDEDFIINLSFVSFVDCEG
jgi:hypothetical protein